MSIIENFFHIFHACCACTMAYKKYFTTMFSLSFSELYRSHNSVRVNAFTKTVDDVSINTDTKASFGAF